MGRVLALDVGEVRIGIALSDPLGITAQPIPAFRRIGPRKDLEHLARLVREHDVRRVIVGLPLMLSGEEGESARTAREFAARLTSHLDDVPVELWDERLTTVEVERVLLAGDVRRDRRKQVVDTLSAVLILQNYLDAASCGGPALS